MSIGTHLTFAKRGERKNNLQSKKKHPFYFFGFAGVTKTKTKQKRKKNSR